MTPTCFMSKATQSIPQTPQTNHSRCSSPVKALNLIVESKSQPTELDNSTIELHAPSRRKKSSQSYCFVDFDFLALIAAAASKPEANERGSSLISRRLHYRGLQSPLLTKRKELWLCANGIFRMRSGMREELWLCANGNI